MQGNTSSICANCKEDFLPATDNTSNVCEKCKKSSYETTHPELHQNTVSDQPLITTQSVLQHDKSIQSSEKSFLCNICKKSFSKKRHLQQHVKNAHEKPYKCDICPMGFGNQTFLRRHKLIHLVPNPFPCDICHRRYVNQKSLDKHIRQIHGKDFPCSICGKSFETKQERTQHKKSHLNDTPVLCDQCGTWCKSISFSAHFAQYHKEKPFSCKRCDKSFPYRCILDRHELSHRSETSQPYEKAEKHLEKK